MVPAVPPAVPRSSAISDSSAIDHSLAHSHWTRPPSGRHHTQSTASLAPPLSSIARRRDDVFWSSTTTGSPLPSSFANFLVFR